MQGAGKTSLLRAILNHGRPSSTPSLENFPMDVDLQESLAGGLCYSDTAGVNLQVLSPNAFSEFLFLLFVYNCIVTWH